MTHPTTLPPRPPEASRPISNKRALPRDIMWDRPIFKAPSLPNVRVLAHPLPFTVARVTHHQPSTTTA